MPKGAEQEMLFSRASTTISSPGLAFQGMKKYRIEPAWMDASTIRRPSGVSLERVDFDVHMRTSGSLKPWS